eukprot:TRINITY_DN22216_c1_g1_i2.p2 TRINITY_DN22216_c1_g1~~TRINITY_DN22216_c1_g1_i2.p2  ORF type:complete len:313 (+),score=48.09 TRINITY_DN22216_c1_g1_i2:83-1021(+)
MGASQSRLRRADGQQPAGPAGWLRRRLRRRSGCRLCGGADRPRPEAPTTRQGSGGGDAAADAQPCGQRALAHARSAGAVRLPDAVLPGGAAPPTPAAAIPPPPPVRPAAPPAQLLGQWYYRQVPSQSTMASDETFVEIEPAPPSPLHEASVQASSGSDAALSLPGTPGSDPGSPACWEEPPPLPPQGLSLLGRLRACTALDVAAEKGELPQEGPHSLDALWEGGTPPQGGPPRRRRGRRQGRVQPGRGFQGQHPAGQSPPASPAPALRPPPAGSAAVTLLCSPSHLTAVSRGLARAGCPLHWFWRESVYCHS